MLAVFLVRFQKMKTLFSSLSSFTLIFIIMLGLRSSNGEDHKHEVCSSTSIMCGRLQNVGYPFWGLGRPNYCGLPDLQLKCETYKGRDCPFLTIGEVDYEVLGIIKNTLPKITIQLQGLNKSGCPNNVSYKDFNRIFHLRESVETITLYECRREDIEEIPSRFKTCWGDNDNCLAYDPDKTLSAKKLHSCTHLQVPVIKEFEIRLHRNGAFNVSQVLQQGFEVDYLYPVACTKCEKSSGTCGSNGEKFACFHRKSDWKLIVGLVVPGALIIIAALNVGFWCCIKRKFYSPVLQSSRLPFVSMKSDIEVGSNFYGIQILPYNELQEATNNFDESQELGDGGFGIVYYGKLKDGREVAVKRLYEKNYKQIEQFMNEIEILTKLHHPNLVTLYGCTSRSSRELLLVYEFIPNGTVADHLYGESKGSKTLSWDIRMKIAIETACALSYLHASEIIHRDVKTNNILLDNNFSVKVADFGLSRLFPCDATHVSTVPQGTPGYLDPQYHKNYQVTNKSDVYSFGVVLVELISSLPAVDISRQEDEINLYDYAMSRIQHGALSELVDQKLSFESDFKVNRMVTLVAELAFRCLQQEKELRPTMDEILEALEEIESMDYKALKAEDTSLRKSASKPISMKMENHIEPSLGNTHHSPSPNSVIVSWVSRSTASNTST